MSHSKIVGGSTAKRVINCPGSVALCAEMPPQPSSPYAEEGTLLHDAISDFLNVCGGSFSVSPELIEDKLLPALKLLDEVDPEMQMEFQVETPVGFGDLLPGVLGTTDLMGRLGDKAIILDWKFGSGVPVPAEKTSN